MLLLVVFSHAAFAGMSAAPRMQQVVEQPTSGDVDGGSVSSGSSEGTSGGVVAP